MLEYLAVPARRPACPLTCQLIYLQGAGCLPRLQTYLFTDLLPALSHAPLTYPPDLLPTRFALVCSRAHLHACIPAHALAACFPARINASMIAYLSARSPEPMSHEAISPQRRDLSRGWEGAKQVLNQLVAFVLVITFFLLPPALFIEYIPNLLYLDRGLYSLLFSLFCTQKYLLFWPAPHNPCPIEQGLIACFITTGPALDVIWSTDDNFSVFLCVKSSKFLGFSCL